MIERHTVTVSAVTTTTDGYGDSTTTSDSSDVAGLLFAPEGLIENAGTEAARVIGDASLYGVMPQMDSDDTVSHDSGCCDGEDFAHGTWQVVGGSKGWGGGRKATAIRRTASA